MICEGFDRSRSDATAIAPDTVGVESACGRISSTRSKSDVLASIGWTLASLPGMGRRLVLVEWPGWVGSAQRRWEPSHEFRIKAAHRVRDQHSVSVSSDEPRPQ